MLEKKVSDEIEVRRSFAISRTASGGDDQLLSDIVMSICHFRCYMYMYIKTGGSDAYFDC